MSRYDNSLIEEIKFRSDIETIVGGYVQLKRSGSNLSGLCPFHSEKSPSFTVYTDTRSFYCFGCGAGGDVITFIKRIENLDYVGALQFLAARAGITLPENDSDERDSVTRTRVYEINKAAARFFFDCLRESPDGLAYLQKRQLSGAVVKRFGIGYAPDSFNSLTNHLRSKGFSDEEMTVAALARKSEKNGRLYDLFRGRLMFPIIDVSGNVIAFGGRITGDGQPKYLNSSDTPAFKKSRNLFALNYAKSCCAERMILCEGYMDVVALHSAGFGYAVATLGTAITKEQARLMKRYTESVIISYDSDEAGQKAADKAFRLLEEAGLKAKILKMEGAKDPDEYIKKFGADKFKAVLEGSVSRFDFELANILSRCDISVTDGKVKAAAEAAEFISWIYSAVERELYISKAADTIGFSAESLKNDVERRIKSNRKRDEQTEKEQRYLQTSAIGDRVNPDAAKNLRTARAEDALLGILLNRPEYMAKIKGGGVDLTPDDFFTALNRKIFEAMLDNTGLDGSFDIGLLGDALTDDEMSRLTRSQLDRRGLENGETVFTECVQALKASRTDKMSIDDIISSKRNKTQNNIN